MPKADIRISKKLNTGLLTRLWYPPTLLVCSYTLQASRQVGILARFSKTAELVGSAEPSGAIPALLISLVAVTHSLLYLESGEDSYQIQSNRACDYCRRRVGGC